MSRLLSGVRSSWDMFARHADLYLDVCADSAAFFSSSALVCCSSWVRACDWASRASDLKADVLVWQTIPMLLPAASRSLRRAWPTGRAKASWITALTSPSNRMGRHTSCRKVPDLGVTERIDLR